MGRVLKALLAASSLAAIVAQEPAISDIELDETPGVDEVCMAALTSVPFVRHLRQQASIAPHKPHIDVAAKCVRKMQKSGDGGESELDQQLAPGVRVFKVPPALTGFPAWRRNKDYVYSQADLRRGFADWVVPDGATHLTPRILYCHGGGYEWYSPQDVYRPATTRIAKATGMPVLAFDYRLSPEFKYPAQLDDAVQAFEWIARNGPDGPSDASAIFIMGDSAGGGLALALALQLRDSPVHGAVVAGVSVVSPETDLTCSGESYRTRRWVKGGGPECDPVFNGPDPAAASMPAIYRLLGAPNTNGAVPPSKSRLSPLHSELHGLPPTQIHVGNAEVMLSDSVDFAAKAKRAGSPVEVTVWPRMWHTFTQFSEGCGGPEPLQEALDALQQQGDFIRGIASRLSVTV
mmetsp:Transcript_31841/g.90855  ORF Transcript_31841/g.90855 Transcript_31841/m.90855 type:complete len:405 (-) Transcript_31841:102-1316(-)